MSRRKPKMRFSDAMMIADDDMPDGAYFAMCEELSGMDVASGVDEMLQEPNTSLAHRTRPHRCPKCDRGFTSEPGMQQHRRDKGH